METKLFAVIIDSVVDGVYLSDSQEIMSALVPDADQIIDVTNYGSLTPSAGWLIDENNVFFDPEAPSDATPENGANEGTPEEIATEADPAP